MKNCVQCWWNKTRKLTWYINENCNECMRFLIWYAEEKKETRQKKHGYDLHTQRNVRLCSGESHHHHRQQPASRISEVARAQRLSFYVRTQARSFRTYARRDRARRTASMKTSFAFWSFVCTLCQPDTHHPSQTTTNEPTHDRRLQTQHTQPTIQTQTHTRTLSHRAIDLVRQTHTQSPDAKLRIFYLAILHNS